VTAAEVPASHWSGTRRGRSSFNVGARNEWCGRGVADERVPRVLIGPNEKNGGAGLKQPLTSVTPVQRPTWVLPGCIVG
jgi:hypothetical protein